MGLLDLFTGGKSSDATDAINKAEGVYAGLTPPSIANLTLPELQKYVNAGLMTPAQAEAILVNGNAFDNVSTDSAPRQSQIAALNKLQAISDSGGMTPTMKAQLTDALDQIKTKEQGDRGALLDSFAARGIPTSLMEGALSSANAGQDAEAANKAATDAAATAEGNTLRAIESAGTLGGQIHGQDYTEAANKANAANAIAQWNAQNKTGVNVSNAGRTQEANAYNAENAQNVANQNTTTANTRTAYNAAVPQTVFQDQATKAAGQAGALKNAADLANQQGKQTQGDIGALLGTAGTVAGAMYGGPAGAIVGNKIGSSLGGGGSMNAAHGAVVPGRAEVPGDSIRNDKIPAMLSPGEVVLPRTLAPHPDQVKDFVAHLMRSRTVKPPHVDDVHALLGALSKRREEANGIV